MFWDRYRDQDFLMFSTPHLIALSIVALCCLLLYGSRFALRTHSGLRRSIRHLLALLLIACEGGLHVWYVSQDIWSRSSSLPLELCGITLLLSVILL
jgi:uncharacterized membrane protein YwaF